MLQKSCYDRIVIAGKFLMFSLNHEHFQCSITFISLQTCKTRLVHMQMHSLRKKNTFIFEEFVVNLITNRCILAQMSYKMEYKYSG